MTDTTPAADLEKAKDFPIFSQRATDYTTLSTTPGQACANCIFYKPTGYGWDGMEKQHCHIVESWPLSIEPTGLCNRWEAIPPVDLTANPLPVVIVDVDADDKAQKPGFIEGVKGAIQNILNPAEPAFQVFKTKDGKKGWIARHTGKFKDREKEILADKSHEEYVNRVEKALVEPPELWMWHAKGTKHGNAITVWKAGGFTLAAGLFDETEEGERAFNYYQKNRGKIKLSHQFNYPKNAKIDGVYYAYNTIEITTLPDGAEAFPYTSFEEIEAMALPEVARSMIKEALGDDALKRAEAADQKAVSDTKTLEGQGVAFKGYDNFDGATIPATADAAALKALQTEHADVVKRLADAEATLKALGDLPDTLKALNDRLTSMSEQVTASQQAASDNLKMYNDLNAKWVEYSSLQPPASKSNDTVLGDREKTLLDKVITEAKATDTPSLVEKLLGGTPAVSTNGGSPV